MMTTETKIPSGELFLRWLRTLPPVQADLMCGLVATHMPEFTKQWIKDGRRLVMDENNEEIEQLLNLIFAAIQDRPKCIFCFERFDGVHAFRAHRRECSDRNHALEHPNEPPYVWPEDMEG